MFFKDFDHNYCDSLKYAANRTLFFHDTSDSKHKKWSFSKRLFSEFEDSRK